MFNRLFTVRIKAAEKALKAGRLDEAFRLVTSPDIREHRQGPNMLGQLADKFMDRARTHLEDERFAEALHDLNKAEAGGVKLDEIAELRKNIQIVADEVNRLAQSKRRRLDQARKHLNDGSLVQGKRVLARADADDHDAKRMADDIEERQQRATEGFAQVERMLKDKQLHPAIERFTRIKALDPHAAKAIALESTLCSRVIANVNEALAAGRISHAITELGLLGTLGQSLPARRDAEETVSLVKNASVALHGDDYESARRHLLRLQRIIPKVGWVKKTAEQLEQLDDILTSLHGGPLGEHAKSVTTQRAKSARLDETVMLPGRRPIASGLPDRLLLLVDGGGSYLILRNDRIALGRALARQQPDIPILSDLAERHAEISRVEDDYFLFSSRDVEVDSRTTRHQLLRDGNRIALARNARFTFRLPHRQSPSAIIDLSSATKMPNDVRRVVLFRQTAMIGVGRTVHITCNAAAADLVLFERAGQMWVRPQRNGRVDTEARTVPIGEQMEVMNVSFVLQPWPAAGPSFS